jgi:hypothetical protein
VRNSGLPDPGHLSALCIGMLALGFFLISNLRIFRIPAMACRKVDEFLEARPISFALPNESDFPRDAKVRDRAKSDGIDAELLLQTLLAWLRGEPPVCSMVPIPIEADEDARRRVRERAELVAERIGLCPMSGWRPLIKGYFCGVAFDRGCGHVFGLLMRVNNARWP